LISVAKIPTPLLLLLSVPAEKVRLLLSYNGVWFVIPWLPCRSVADDYLYSTSQWEHSGSPSIAGNSNKIRLISHLVEHFP
jgi:hypothetical protein